MFTGKERDSESGNDYFGARYYASSDLIPVFRTQPNTIFVVRRIRSDVEDLNRNI